ncbi:MAG: UDP-N-acetylmuramoyl-L-alanyl-D-glutamate--2,6-diaminopimelate ligase [Synergistaceae bacterium]|jgi:UDP-N-acetylmuramoyl-L-alanyl-D-glutamate--2,6-diaminopimelate ligase|nr:UDP-N-acetylmuramoyl-L-alanyl-D-glutamate--2,6-diaminopimelate ligase [Synergistaceae bacterium]
MKLSAVVQSLAKKGFVFTYSSAKGDPAVSDVFSDSRRVLPGSIFCCIAGAKNDGHQYAPMAEAAGAVALVCEHPVTTELPVLLVESTRDIMGDLASIVYGEPASKLLMIGVTGTNGKSSTTYILRSILQAAGLKSGLLGTVVESDGVRERDAERTTPESCHIQRQLAAMVKNKCGACVMETSSHGLQGGRLNGCRFDVAVFTNLNPEHLDFHKNMENYFQAKRLLFTKYFKEDRKEDQKENGKGNGNGNGNRVAAVNADDPYGVRLLKEFPGARGFSFADLSDVELGMDGSSFTIGTHGPGGPPLSLKSPLVGNFNVANVLAAVTALRGRFEDAVIAKGVAEIPQIPGRLEKHRLPNGACCVIDFAHTPEALRNILSVARGFCAGKLISIFGHGGGRYASNRPALGAVAASLADLILVTMDNPRDEDPATIADDIVEGIENHSRQEGKETKYRVILDRKEAISTALCIAGPDDVLVVSGKGAEKYLTIKDQKIPYSDAETVEDWIRLAK